MCTTITTCVKYLPSSGFTFAKELLDDHISFVTLTCFASAGAKRGADSYKHM